MDSLYTCTKLRVGDLWAHPNFNALQHIINDAQLSLQSDDIYFILDDHYLLGLSWNKLPLYIGHSHMWPDGPIPHALPLYLQKNILKKENGAPQASINNTALPLHREQQFPTADAKSPNSAEKDRSLTSKSSGTITSLNPRNWNLGSFFTSPSPRIIKKNSLRNLTEGEISSDKEAGEVGLSEGQQCNTVSASDSNLVHGSKRSEHDLTSSQVAILPRIARRSSSESVLNHSAKLENESHNHDALTNNGCASEKPLFSAINVFLPSKSEGASDAAAARKVWHATVI